MKAKAEKEIFEWLKLNYPNLQLYPIEAKELAEMIDNYHLSQSSVPSGVKWVATINRLPKENQKVLCWNGHRMIENSWMQYTGSDEAWFKKTFTHWATVVEPPSAIKQSQQGGQDSGQVGGQDENN